MENFDKFCHSDVAKATLRAVYDVMAAAYHLYPDEPWRRISPKEHATKAFMHAMRAHENLAQIEDGMGANTGKSDWQHALTRLAFVATLLAPVVDDRAIVVDTTELEVAE